MIYIAGDHRGFYQKDEIKEWLRLQGLAVTDLGNSIYDKNDDYADFGFKLGEKVVQEKAKGILICGSGVGITMAANKVKGVRAGLCMNEKQAVSARNDDDINVLCLSADLVSPEENQKIVKAFLETLFGSQEKYIRRIQKMKNYEQENFAGRPKNTLPSVKEVLPNSTVVLRMDTDVPMENGRILDNQRLVKSISTIKVLLEKGCRIIVLGHLGRPEGKEESLSLKPVFEVLRGLLEVHKILATSDFAVDVGNTEDIKIKLQHNQIVFVENIRFWKEEEKEDGTFLQNLVELGDAYVDDAFSVAHRTNASMMLFKRMKGYYGLSFINEAEKIGAAIENPERPVTVILGGAKEDKLKYLPELIKKADYVLIGGKLPKIIQDKENLDKKVIVANLAENGLDLSDEDIKKFKEIISNSKTIIWAGAMGLYEDEKERHGTEEIARAVAEAEGYKIIAGGDTGASIANLGLRSKIDFVCSGGGVMLEYLTKGKLPTWR